jgi:hypothetical protein
MSFARLLSKDAGVGSPDAGGDNVEKAPDAQAGLHDAAKRMLDTVKANDHEGFSAALADWHELRGASGPNASAKSEDAKPEGAFGE